MEEARERIARWREDVLVPLFPPNSRGLGEIVRRGRSDYGKALRRAFVLPSPQSLPSRTTGNDDDDDDDDENATTDEDACSPLSAMRNQDFSFVFRKKELVRIVKQDVQRIVFESASFGGKKFWQSRKVRAALIRCMTVFVLEMQSKSRKDNASKEIMVEYKQGMHEILAMVYLATSRAATSFAEESFEGGSDELDELDDDDDENNDDGLDVSLVVRDNEDNEEEGEGEYSEKFVEHDCFALFSAFANNTKSSLRLLEYFQSQNDSFIDEYCERFRRRMYAADAVTARIFFSKMSLTRLYLPRFLKLVYVREFKRCEFLLMIWDAIIAEMGREGKSHHLSSNNEPLSTLPSARDIFESLSVAAVLGCKDTIIHEHTYYSAESVGNIINKINSFSSGFTKPSDVENLIQMAKVIAGAKYEDDDEDDEDDDEQFFDESVFKCDMFAAMGIEDESYHARKKKAS